MFDFINSILKNGANLLWGMVALPAVFAILIRLAKKDHILRLILTLAVCAANLLFAAALYRSGGFSVRFPFAGPGFDMALRVSRFPALFLLLTAAVICVVGVYSAVFLKEKAYAGRFLFYLFVSLAMLNGAFLSDHLGVMLFFWEGLLCTLLGILLINNKNNPKTAVKALVLSGTADLLLMLGIAVTVYAAKTPYLSEIQKLPVTGLNAVGFGCMMLGALGKAGAMPFHSWIPDAAADAPTPFLAAFPGSLEKLAGIYLAARLVTDLYDLKPGSGMSVAVMTLGTLTIVFAVSMALVQKDMKRLLSYHAISQVGYMVLGLGTGLPIGIAGGLAHMINHVIYKSGLFMAAGAVEKQTGTTDLREIGGLGKKMPVTMVCFTVCGLAISGVPPLNGFFSKELIFDAALESNAVFYVGALLGAFLTAVSFLKMGRAAFSGTLRLPGKKSVREAGAGLLIPMGIMAVFCVLFGVFNAWPIDRLFGSALGYTESFAGWPKSVLLVVISMAALLLALGDHLYGCKKAGSPINAADHIHDAPVLKNIYHAAEKQRFDPYVWLTNAVNGFSWLCSRIERGVSWVYDTGIVRLTEGAGNMLRRASNGSLARYLFFAITGVALITAVFLAILL